MIKGSEWIAGGIFTVTIIGLATLFITVRRTGLQIYIDGTNLLGARYYDFGGAMPSRWLSGGIVITIR